MGPPGSFSSAVFWIGAVRFFGGMGFTFSERDGRDGDLGRCPRLVWDRPLAWWVGGGGERGVRVIGYRSRLESGLICWRLAGFGLEGILRRMGSDLGRDR